MQLTSLSYSEFPGQDAEWTLEPLSLSKVNLVVGKNATGKTRTINAINFLSTLFTGQQREIAYSASCHAVFEEGGKNWEYTLTFDNSAVVNENLLFNGDAVLQRSQGGYGKILAEDIDGQGKKIKFSIPGSQVAVFAKLDNTQHTFLQPLHEWASSVRHFKLGSDISPATLALAIKQPISVPVNEKETTQLVPIFDKARKELGDPYVDAIIADMKELGYHIHSLAIRRPDHFVTNVILPGEIVGLSVKEDDLGCYVDQPSMSQGMYRALSLLAQVNYYALARKNTCILADDIGEGLDFERSCAMIDLLRRKAHESEAFLQLVMSTNNRFVMNRVPLEEWCLLQREGHHVRVRNYANSKDSFERFKMTGLNNFDFLRYDFINEDPESVFEEVGAGSAE
jgi:AAA domain, putative AbiEii toxin, Type IV TA system